MSYRMWLVSVSFSLAVVSGAGASEGVQPQSKAVGVVGQVKIEGVAGLQKPDLSRAVVYLSSDPKLDLPPPAGSLRPEIGQRQKTFIPDLLVVVRGTVVEFPNWDPFTHNVFSRSRAASFDLDRYPYGQSKSYQFNEVGIVQLFCNIHPQMKAIIVVTPNRFFARADAQGRFRLPPVAPGKYELVAWHERCDEERVSFEVKPDEPTQISVSLHESRQQRLSNRPSLRREAFGVERGLGLRRERLDLPLVEDAHPAPSRGPQR